MKRRIMAVVLTMTMLFSMIPRTYATEDHEARIYAFLTGTLGLNPAAACGVLGNLHVETGGTFSPDSYNPNDSGGTKSFGICQWNNGAGAGNRYGQLIGWCGANGLDANSLEGQLRFMQHELESTPYFRLSALKTVENTADGAYRAAQLWAIYYEGCSSASYERRGNLAKNTYWPKYGAKPARIWPSACGGDQNKCPSARFRDVSPYGSWDHGGIDYVLSHGFFTGTGETTFSPNSVMTRAMLVTVLWRGCASPEGYENPFSDVPAGAWYETAAAWGHASGIVKGLGGDRFGPDGLVTREQMATILFRLAGLAGYDTGKRASLSGFPDQGQVSDWAKDALSWAIAEGIVTGSAVGDTTWLRPGYGSTRAQAAAVLMRFSELYNG